MSDQERKLFEDALEGEAHFWWISEVGQYNSTITQQMWKAWQRARQAPASGEVEPLAYVCHSCGNQTPPPAPFKMYVVCPCGHSTAATVAANLAKEAHPPAKVPDGSLLDLITNAAKPFMTVRNVGRFRQALRGLLTATLQPLREQEGK